MCQKCPSVGKPVKVAKAGVKKPVYYFPSSAIAWAFMKWCDSKGISAGYPSLEETEEGYGVMVAEHKANLGVLFAASLEGQTAAKSEQDRRLRVGLAKLTKSFTF